MPEVSTMDQRRMGDTWSAWKFRAIKLKRDAGLVELVCKSSAHVQPPINAMHWADPLELTYAILVK